MSDKLEFEIPEDLQLELKVLKKRVNELEVQNSRLKEVIVENELQNEIEFDCSSIEEGICINGINYIASLVRDQVFEKKDVESFEKLFNILRTIRGKSTASKKKVTGDVKELLKIVEGE